MVRPRRPFRRLFPVLGVGWPWGPYPPQECKPGRLRAGKTEGMRLPWAAKLAIVAVLVAPAVSCSPGDPEVTAPADQVTPTLLSTPSEAPRTEEPVGSLAGCGSPDVPEGGAKVSEQEAIEIAFSDRTDATCDDVITRYYWIKNEPRWKVILTDRGCEDITRVDAVSGKLIGRTGVCP